MARFTNPIPFYNDEKGRTLKNAKLYFYDSGTFDVKDTYSDAALTSVNPNPVVADGAGRFPNIFMGTGSYRLVLEDEDGVEIATKDDVANIIGDGEDISTALNVTTATDTQTVAEALDNRIGKFESLSDAVSAVNAGDVDVGVRVETLSYYGGWTEGADDPKGGNVYELVDAGSAGARPAEDDGSVIHCTGGSGGLYLKGLFLNGVDAYQFGPVGDGVADDTTPISSFFNYLQSESISGSAGLGTFRLTSPILIKKPVKLFGIMPSPFISTYTGTDVPNTMGPGTWFHLDHSGLGFRVEHDEVNDGNERLTGVELNGFGTFRTHNQDTGTGWTPTVYDWDIAFYANTFSFPFDSVVKNAVLLNPYKAITAKRLDPLDSGSVGRIKLENVLSQPLFRGVEIDHAYGRCTLDYVQFWTYWDTGDAVLDWTRDNGTAFSWGRADRCTMTECFAYGYRTTLRTFDTTDPAGGGATLFLTDFGADNAGVIPLDISGSDGEIHINNVSAFGFVSGTPINRGLYVTGDNNKIFVRGGRIRNTKKSLVDVAGTGNKVTLGDIALWGWDFDNNGDPAITCSAGNTVVNAGGIDFDVINSPTTTTTLFGGTGTYLNRDHNNRSGGLFSGTTDGSGFLTIPHGLYAAPAWATATIDAQAAAPGLSYNAVMYDSDASNLTVYIKDDSGASVTSTSVSVNWFAALF